MKRGRGVRLICELIIIICVVLIIGALTCAGYYLLRDPGTPDQKLMDSLHEFAQFYEHQEEDSSLDDGWETVESLPASDMDVTGQEDKGAESVGIKGMINKEAGNSNMTELQQGNETDAVQDQGGLEETGESNEFNESDESGQYQENDRSSEENESDFSGREAQIRDMVNTLSLSPGMPELEELKVVLNDLMPQILEGCGDTYEQVKACYDYLITKCEYSDTVKYTYEYDAYLLLTEFHGSCTYYVAALHYMLLYIGVENSVIDGYRYPHPESSDRTSFHRWIEIKLNGVNYVLDPQWEDTLSHDGRLSYKRFFYTHEELEDYYVF